MRDDLNLPVSSLRTVRLYFGYRSSAAFRGRRG
jgi:hypothetical protein